MQELAEMQRDDRGYDEYVPYVNNDRGGLEEGSSNAQGGTHAGDHHDAHAQGQGTSFLENNSSDKQPADALEDSHRISPAFPLTSPGLSGGQGPAGGLGPAGGQGPVGRQGSAGGQGPAGRKGSSGGQGQSGTRGPAGARGPAGRVGQPLDSSWAIFEFNQLKERIGQMERKSEALWHVQEQDQELRGMMDRLRNDLESARSAVFEVQSSTRASHDLVDKLERTAVSSGTSLRELKDKVAHMDTQLAKAGEEKRDAAAKLENNVNLIWDQIRHVENSLSQRLTLAETSQIGTLQEVDEMKESAGEVMTRVEDVRRHIAALESKLESFNTQVAAAMSPLHSSLTEIKIRLEDLNQRKQDAESAVTLDDVSVAASRAIDHADRRADNIVKSIASMEDRVEELNGNKANKCDVVLTSDLEALLTAHATEMDRHLDALKKETLVLMGTKSDKDEMAMLDAKLGARIGSLEAAILKGLKAISDKVTAALAEKLDLLRFNEFKLQVRAILADIEDRLRDWSPMSGGSKSPLDGSTGAAGATSCLLCDRRVRSSAEMKSKDSHSPILTAADRIFAPEKIPEGSGLLPSISERNSSPSAAINARHASRKKDSNALLNSLSTATLPEQLPSSPQKGGSMLTTNTIDLSGLGNGSPNKMLIDVETIAGNASPGGKSSNGSKTSNASRFGGAA